MKKFIKLFFYVLLPLLLIVTVGMFIMNPPVPTSDVTIDLPVNHVQKCLFKDA